MLLPVLAETFGVSVDDLLGRTVAVRAVESEPLPVPEPEPAPEQEPERAKTPGPRPTKLHICITELGGSERVNVSLPLTGVRAMASFASLIPGVRTSMGRGVDMEEIFAAAQGVGPGTLITIE